MIPISDRLQQLFSSKEYTPILILEIDGLPTVASGPVKKTLCFDDDEFFFDAGFSLDSAITDKSVQLLIDMKSSSNSITQQLLEGKGAGGAQTFTVSLVDKQGIVTEWITPGLVVDDIISKRAKVYLSAVGGVHPEDSLLLLVGVIEGYAAGAGRIDATITSAEKLKQSDAFLKATTEIQDYPAWSTTLASDSAAGHSNFVCVDGSGFPQASIGDRFLIKVGADIWSYSYRNGNTLIYRQVGEVTTVHPFYPAGTTVELYRVWSAGQSWTLRLKDASQIIPPNSDTTLETYLKIDDEIVKVLSMGGNYVENTERGCFGTIAADHDYGATVEVFYRLQGTMKDLALKLMLSGGDEYFYDGTGDLTTSGSETIANAVFIDDPRFEEKGARVGDTVKVTTNLITAEAAILSMGRVDRLAYMVLDYALPTYAGARIQIKSQYNTLPKDAGLGLYPDLVDIDQHEEIHTRYFAQLFEYDFFLKDQINVAEFINNQLYYPSGCHQLSRKGRASLGVTAPPLAVNDTPTLDASNIVSPSSIRVARSFSKNFYNAVIYSYDPDQVEDKYRRAYIHWNETSRARVKVPPKPLEIQAEGVRYVSGIEEQFAAQARRFMDRYQFGAETFDVRVQYSLGVRIELGDAVIFDGEDLNISDTATQNGTRNFVSRIMEVTSKRLQPWSNEVILTLTDTSFALNGRYGLIGPSSVLTAGTVDYLYLAVSFGTSVQGLTDETWKWKAYLGEYIAVRSDDWSYYEERRILRLEENIIVLDQALSAPPAAGYFVDVPKYPDTTDVADMKSWKRITTFINPTVSIVSSTARDRFTVDPGEIAHFQEGAVVMVHDDAYNFKSDDFVVDSIVSNTVILNKALPFDMAAGFKVELIGFKDGGLPYRLL